MTGFEAVGVLGKASYPPSEKSAARATIPVQTWFCEAQKCSAARDREELLSVSMTVATAEETETAEKLAIRMGCCYLFSVICVGF